LKITDTSELVFETYTGSVYHVSEGKIRRLNLDYEKRGDGNWYTLYNRPEIEVGHPAFLMMESLAAFGVDDYGTEGGALTTRTTSEVVRIDVLNDEEVAW
jgi:hypothetical protein